MRLTSLEDISKLGKHAQKQIAKHLSAQPLFIDKRSFDTGKVKVEKKPDKKKKLARVMKTDEKFNYCPYPNPDPSVWLHIALLKEFGSFNEGGELVDEMILSGHEVMFRFDFCLPRYKLAIEVDGFGYHRDLKSFKKDREKQKHALKNGWVVHRLTNSNIRNEFDMIIPDIYTMLTYRDKGSAIIEPVGKTWCKNVNC